MKGMDLVEWRRDAEKEKEDWEKEKKGPLETDLQRRRESWSGPNKTEQGNRDGQTADKDGQTADGKGRCGDKDPGENTQLVCDRQEVLEQTDRRKRENRGGGGQSEKGKQGQDRQTGSERGKHETDRQMAGTRGCPGLPAFCCVYQLIELNCCQRCN